MCARGRPPGKNAHAQKCNSPTNPTPPPPSPWTRTGATDQASGRVPGGWGATAHLGPGPAGGRIARARRESPDDDPARVPARASCNAPVRLRLFGPVRSPPAKGAAHARHPHTLFALARAPCTAPPAARASLQPNSRGLVTAPMQPSAVSPRQLRRGSTRLNLRATYPKHIHMAAFPPLNSRLQLNPSLRPDSSLQPNSFLKLSSLLQLNSDGMVTAGHDSRRSGTCRHTACQESPQQSTSRP